ncbi:hypothetical protein DFP73DRAFT_569914 [Morchella snyderi]|nr:hypothetical protein DFP73DRAFT_569914 [Morchella snyderi]
MSRVAHKAQHSTIPYRNPDSFNIFSFTMSTHIKEGKAIVSLSGGSFLAEYEKHAVVRLDDRTTEWTTRLYQPSGDDPPAIIFIKSKDTEQQRCLTLDTSGGSNDNNVIVENLEIPRPKMSQLWTFEEAGFDPSHPEFLFVRIQSIARPSLSPAICGNVPVLKLDQNIAGVMNHPWADSQRWTIEYLWNQIAGMNW